MSYKKLVYAVAVLPLALFGIFSIVYNWHNNLRAATHDYEQVLLQAVRRERLNLEDAFQTAADGLHTATRMLGATLDRDSLNTLTDDEVDDQMRWALGRHPATYASCVAFIDDWNDVGGKRLFRLAIKEGPAEPKATMIDLTDSNFENEPWFTTPRELGRGYWNEPYYYPEFGAWIITYLYPITVEGKFVGELGVGWLVDKLNDELNEHASELGAGVYCAIVNSRGDYLMHPDLDYIQNKVNMFAIDQQGEGHEGWTAVRAAMDKREIGFARVETRHARGDRLYAMVAPLSLNDWSLVLFLPERNFLVPIQAQLFIQFAFMAVLMAAALAAVTVGIRAFTKPLNDILAAARAYNNGKLISIDRSYRFTEFDTLATAYNAMVDTIQTRTGMMEQSIASLDNVVRTVSDMAGELNTVADQMNDSSLQLSSSAVEQESVFTEIASSIASLKDHADSNAGLSDATNAKIAEVDKLAGAGNSEMDRLSTAMADIAARTKSIYDALKSIDTIAFQTNILALNAAVEAARAGAHGKGFSVVATEVQLLANRSAKSVETTAKILDESAESVGTGVELGRRTAESFERIVALAADAADMMTRVTSQAGEQSAAVREILAGLSEVAQIAEKNVENATSHATMATQLSGLVRTMYDLLRDCRRSTKCLDNDRT